MIYFDNSATTKPYPEVLKTFHQVADQYFGNPSSIHRFGGESERLLKKAKEQASNLLGVEIDEVIFTSGGTESNNLAIKGIALQHQNRGKHIITTEIEHPSVLEACKALEKIDFDVTYLPVNKEGKINVQQLHDTIRTDTILISVMHVNNELGTIQPIKEIADIANQYPKLFFHVDHVQGLGKVQLPFNHPGIDLCSMSAHKIHGLKGTGLLYIKKGTTLFPLLHGGGQEGAKRPGTENLAGIVAMVKAMRMIMDKQTNESHHLNEMATKLRSCLANNKRVHLNSPEDGAPHILNYSVPGFKPEVVIHALSEKGIFISTKSACSSKHTDESAVLAACGLDERYTTSALRVSLSYDNTREEVETFCKAFEETVSQLSDVMG
ncbi:cysteine desulfurase family protein [Salirhabdus salicampi]|uniref:cysteine desulfurase family protein n=1 Tax=Salirhabdus salicampi TaxID=476102 RepID=UPI0020C31B65|nr:cysteine desulfurase family protein [Salirhabdus salicampi]MCP8617130.1 cysteine desulfurase [Salirhabdus salicampi]